MDYDNPMEIVLGEHRDGEAAEPIPGLASFQGKQTADLVAAETCVIDTRTG
jgi:hypothetical protein